MHTYVLPISTKVNSQWFSFSTQSLMKVLFIIKGKTTAPSNFYESLTGGRDSGLGF